jgi:hypothetical protein
LSVYPRRSREYSALEVTFEHSPGNGRGLLASYVLSRTYGNYAGLFDTDYEMPAPNFSLSFDWPSMVSSGLLPSDRPHVLKIAGFRPIAYGITGGISLVWQSGTPINEFGGMPEADQHLAFVSKRGTVGRSPSIWDLNLRLQYTPFQASERRLPPKVTVDFLHLGSRERPVLYDETHYFGLDEDGNQTNPSPNFLQPTRYQPPMAVRLGIEVGF